eukprot:10612268-Alexandrium_andersonii.AAC.1
MEIERPSVSDMDLVTKRDPSLINLGYDIFSSLATVLSRTGAGDDGARLSVVAQTRCLFGG